MNTSKTIYISVKGNDHNAGTAPDAPIRTLGNAVSKITDDTCVLLEGGYVYSGCLDLTGISNVFIGSYGLGTATISSGNRTGILLTDCNTVTVSKIKVKGAGFRICNQSMGVHARNSKNVHIRSVEACDYHAAGIHFSACYDSDILGCFAHDNGSVGISAGSLEDLYSENIRIAYCKVYDNAGDYQNRHNHSGSGIIIGGATHSVVEFCEAAGNGWAQRQVHVNGPVGIWCCCGASDVMFRYNISRNNRTQPGAIDGDGLDIDGEVKDGAMEFNYTYDNEGSGYLLCEYWGACSDVLWENNRASYCVSLDDDYRVPGYGSINMSSPQDVPFKKMRIHDNLFVATKDMHCVINKNIPSSAEDMRIDHNVLVSDGISAIQQPDQPYIQMEANECIEDNAVRESIIAAAPRLTEPRDLLEQPVFDYLKEGTCSKVLQEKGPEALFRKNDGKKPIDGTLMLELQLYGPDLDGSDKSGEVALYYDSIRPGVVTRLTGAGSEVYTPMTWWNKGNNYILRATYRLQSPEVKAYLFVRDADGIEQRKYLSGSVAGYQFTEMLFTPAEGSWYDPGKYLGVHLENDNGNLYLYSIEMVEITENKASDFKLDTTVPIRSFGDCFAENGSIVLNGSGWAEHTIAWEHKPIELTISYDSADALGCFYMKSYDSLVTKAIDNSGKACLKLDVADGAVTFGVDIDSTSVGVIHIHDITFSVE